MPGRPHFEERAFAARCHAAVANPFLLYPLIVTVVTAWLWIERDDLILSCSYLVACCILLPGLTLAGGLHVRRAYPGELRFVGMRIGVAIILGEVIAVTAYVLMFIGYAGMWG